MSLQRGITPSKTCASLINPTGCIICQKEEANARKRRSLSRKTLPELTRKLVEVLEVPIEIFENTCNRYICESPCSRDLENYFKYKRKSEDLKNDLKNQFNANCNRRTKRGQPTDVEPEHCVKSRSAKSLAFSTTNNGPEVELQIIPDTDSVPLLPAAESQQSEGREGVHDEEPTLMEVDVDAITDIEECQTIEVRNLSFKLYKYEKSPKL